MKYIGFFSSEAAKAHDLVCSPAGKTKMEYIAEILNDVRGKPEIISPSWTKAKGLHFYPAVKENAEYYQFTSFPTFSVPYRFLVPFQWLYSLGQLIFYLLSNLKNNETILVYHSLYLIVPLLIVKAVKKCRMILEVEEIYQDVNKIPGFLAWLEYKMFDKSDAYILSTKKLTEKLQEQKPYVVVNGTYKIQARSSGKPFGDGKIHCVYAGTFDPTKGGAAAAAAAAAFLPENYHVHILGFGTESETRQLLEQISKVKETTKCTLTYDGLKTGREYIDFLQKCRIGLCTQIPDAKYADTSFPSKILVYLANGLRVVSVRIPVVDQSEVADLVTFYETQTPENIAKAIVSIDLEDEYDPRSRLKQLHQTAEKNLINLLKKV